MLPNSNHSQAPCLQDSSVHDIARLVAIKLSLPESAVSVWNMTASRAAMPETPIDKYRDSFFWEIDVGVALNALRMQLPTSESRTHECHAELSFGRLRVLALNGRHRSRPFRAHIQEFSLG